MGSDAVHDLNSLLSSKERDFLIRNNGDQVKISSIIGKNLGLYFSASWCIPCCIFTPKLAKLYNELASSNVDFEVIFVSSDKNEDSFEDYFSRMPWLSIPFYDSDIIKNLNDVFNVESIPHLVIDANGKVSSDEGMRLVGEYGVEAYPFTSQHIKLLKDKEEEAKNNQTISSLLSSTSRDYVISNDGIQTKVCELEGKHVGLYFSRHGNEFTQILIETYKKMKEKFEEKFEIVLISLDGEDDDEAFKESFKTMPWLALPFQDEKCQNLIQYFEVSHVPTLVVIGRDGKTLNPNAVELIEQRGVDAYPFGHEKPEEPAEDPNAELEKSQTVECPEKKDANREFCCCCNEPANYELKVEEGKEE